jgi:hypothetical protein
MRILNITPDIIYLFTVLLDAFQAILMPHSDWARTFVIMGAGTGLGFLAVMKGYFPVLHSALSRREANISLPDVLASSLPPAAERVRRYAREGVNRALSMLLAGRGRWSTELLENQMSDRILCHFRSLQNNRSWIKVLILVFVALNGVAIAQDPVVPVEASQMHRNASAGSHADPGPRATIMAISEKTTPPGFVHPGILLSGQQLEYVKRMVAAHAEPFYSAFLKAQRSEWGALGYKPHGPPEDGYIKCGPVSRPNIGCKNADNDGTAAYTQALLWYITGNKTYAENSIRILNTYGRQLKGYAQERPYSNAPLQAAWDGQHWPRAAEIIRYSNAGWKDSDIAAFEQMLRTAILPMVRNGSPQNGNWEISMNEALIGIGVFTNDRALFDAGLRHWRERTPAFFYLHADGLRPVASPRGDVSWYGQKVFNASMDGIQQETCRDFNHAQYGIAGTLDAAETARIQGVDLYSEQTQRLTAAMEFNSRYLLEQPVPESVCDGQLHLVHDPTYEIGYNEFHNRLGIDLPSTRQYIEEEIRRQPTPVDIHMMIFETLTHGGDARSLR